MSRKVITFKSVCIVIDRPTHVWNIDTNVSDIFENNSINTRNTEKIVG
jgi:hypothetical protein